MTSVSVKLPDIGEGVTQAEIVEWFVGVGDHVEEDAPLVSVMTDKATVEIPSLCAGTVRWVAGSIGDVLSIGAELARIDTKVSGNRSFKASPDVTSPQMAPPVAAKEVASAQGMDAGVGNRVLLPVRLPDIGEGVTEAELVGWYVKVGDKVMEDDLLAAVMTDKATVEIPSLFGGTVVELGGAIGESVAVGATLVLIETYQAAATASPLPAAQEGAGVKVEAEAEADIKSPQLGKLAHGYHAKPPPMKVAPRPEGAPVMASPSVRARARAGGVDLRFVGGSGPGGRISHGDLDQVFAGAATGGSTGSTPMRAPRSGSKEIKVVGLRRKIAERMALANTRIPHITVIEEIDVSALEDLREKLNGSRGEKPKLTVLPFVTAALTRAFIDHPEMNAHFDDEAGVVTRHAAVHLGIATMTESGLVVPVLKNAEAIGLFQTAAEIARLSEAARSGKASRDELSGSTFTITSLGPLGAVATTPIINHPEVAILGINKMAVRPMWDGSQFQPRKMMNISASFDHRVIDGWDAAVFVQKVKSLLETPALIFVSDDI